MKTPSKQQLYELYWRNDLYLHEIGERYNADSATVSSWMDEYGVPRNRHNADIYAFHQLSKHYLYDVYWGEHMDTVEIAAKHNVGPRVVRERFNDLGIPRACSGTHDTFLFAMRQKRYYYKLYWGEWLTHKEIADRENVGESFVTKQLGKSAMPTRSGAPPTDDPSLVPPRYRWPDETPVAPVTDDPTADLPDDPDGSKYLADESKVQFDKERLYELYWGYGLAFKHLAERLDIHRSTLEEQFERYGIPRRRWHEHTTWEPHHGVPPKYEWPHDHGVGEDEPNVQNGIWRQATTATGD